MNHYSLVIRFSVGLMGFWALSDNLRLNIYDKKNSLVFDYHPKCDYFKGLCNPNISSECIAVH